MPLLIRKHPPGMPTKRRRATSAGANSNLAPVGPQFLLRIFLVRTIQLGTSRCDVRFSNVRFCSALSTLNDQLSTQRETDLRLRVHPWLEPVATLAGGRPSATASPYCFSR